MAPLRGRACRVALRTWRPPMPPRHDCCPERCTMAGATAGKSRIYLELRLKFAFLLLLCLSDHNKNDFIRIRTRSKSSWPVVGLHTAFRDPMLRDNGTGIRLLKEPARRMVGEQRGDGVEGTQGRALRAAAGHGCGAGAQRPLSPPMQEAGNSPATCAERAGLRVSTREERPLEP